MRTLAELIPLRTAACRDAVDAVGMVAAGDGEVDPKQADHVATCLRCQAEVAAFRRVLATMRAMRGEEMAFSLERRQVVFEALRDGEALPPTWAVRAAYVGGITAAAGAGVIVWLTRRRPGLLSSAS
ncbi:MAG TPA: hypothetical protein VG435_15155 [Acidimicrobiales bacterium]|jgi:hypothetical protein|nr:hypothetical protein [Acidimicrobiales bacterium]